MGTVPTDKLERELRKLYLVWLAGLPRHTDDTAAYIDQFKRDSTLLIARLGGQAASLGALGDFPTPKLLELSPKAGVVYDQMQQAAIQSGIAAGLQATDIARQMLNAGLDKSFRKLNRLARTETVSAYWKNQWDSVADLPAIVMVWGSEESKRTCDYCLSRDGLVVEDPNIRDHPNGRCTLIPTLRSAVKYKGTLQPDGSVDMDPRWAQQKIAGAKATPSAGPTTSEQRDPLSGKSNPAAPSQAQAAQASAPRPTPGNISANEKIRNAETMYGTGSPQHKAAMARFGDTPAPASNVPTFGSKVDAKTRKARIAEGDWRYIDDRKQRAATLLQNDYRAEQAIKKAAKNLRNGKDPFDGVAVPKGWSKDYTGNVTDVGIRYTADDVRNALEDAARWLVEQDTVNPRVMFKGLDVPKDKIAKLFKEGGTFDTNYSSFSTDETIARGYSSRRATAQVIVRVKNAPAVKVDGNPTADFWKKTKEHLVSGQGRITGVTEAHGGRTVYVDVTFG